MYRLVLKLMAILGIITSHGCGCRVVYFTSYHECPWPVLGPSRNARMLVPGPWAASSQLAMDVIVQMLFVDLVLDVRLLKEVHATFSIVLGVMH